MSFVWLMTTCITNSDTTRHYCHNFCDCNLMCKKDHVTDYWLLNQSSRSWLTIVATHSTPVTVTTEQEEENLIRG